MRIESRIIEELNIMWYKIRAYMSVCEIMIKWKLNIDKNIEKKDKIIEYYNTDFIL